jgi:hypothetical protein
MVFWSTFGLGLFRASLDINQAFFLPLLLTVGLPLTLLLTGFLTASILFVMMSGRSMLGKNEGLAGGRRIWNGTGGSTIVSLTTALSIWTESESAKLFRDRKACQLLL